MRGARRRTPCDDRAKCVCENSADQRVVTSENAGDFGMHPAECGQREVSTLTIFLDLDGTLLDHDAAERSAAIEFFGELQSEFPPWSPTEFADLWQMIAQKHLDAYLGGRLSFKE
jgi:hypothetical protein